MRGGGREGLLGFCECERYGKEDEMNIEDIAVAAVKRILSRSDFLVANINSGDRKPTWDGEIEVYKTPTNTHSKKDLFWEIPVQVKGKVVEDVNQNEIKFSVEIVDMKNYLTIKGGTIFFVVYMDEKGETIKIYYKSFLPHDLRPILKNFGHQQSREIEFKVFPEDIDEITYILVSFANDMRKQRTTIDIKYEEIGNALINGENIGELTFGWPRISNGQQPSEIFFEHGFYLYVNLKEWNLFYPLSHVDHIERVSQTRKCNVTVKGSLFYDQVEFGLKKNEVEIQIGKSIKMIGYREENGANVKFSVSLAGTIAERINTVEFLLALWEAGQFEIDTDVYSLNKEMLDLPDSFTASSLERYLNELSLAKRTLETLKVSQELNCDEMTEKDYVNLRVLKKAVIDNELIPLSLKKSGYGFYSIANLHILVFGHEEQGGRFKVYNFFDKRITMKVALADGRRYDMVPCVFLAKDDLLKCSNLNVNDIILSVVNTPLSDVFSTHLTQFLLELLKAYDESGSQREDILEIALELSDWIVREDTSCPKEISKINYYQSVKRKRELNAEEIVDLMVFIESGLDGAELYVGAYLLLDNQMMASHHFKRMNIEEQKVFRQYPIYHFAEFVE